MQKEKIDIEKQGFNGQPNIIEDKTYLSSTLIGISDTEDLISEKFLVLTKQQNMHLSTEFSTVFEVQAANGPENTDYYARVYTRSYPTRIRHLLELKSSNIENFNSPKAVEIVYLTEHKRQYLTTVFSKIKGKSLSNLIKEGRTFSEEFILKKIILPVAQILDKLHYNVLLHGSINLDTIFLDENDQVILDECFYGPCGINQKAAFETPQRLQVQSYAKDSTNFSADYYALGVVALALLDHGNLSSKLINADTITKRLSKGSYKYYTEGTYLDHTWSMLIKGMLYNDSQNRWRYNQIKNAIENHEFAKTSQETIIKSKKPLWFNGKQFFELTSLAYEMSLYWEEAKEFLKKNDIIEWLSEINGGQEIIAHMHEIYKEKRFVLDLSNAATRSDRTLAKLLLIFDKNAPLRFKNIAVFYDKSSIGSMSAYFIKKRDNFKIEQFLDLLKSDIIHFAERLFSETNVNNTNYINSTNNLSLAINHLINNYSELGLSRFFYEINDDIPYTGKLISSKLCYSPTDIMHELNNLQINILDAIDNQNLKSFLLTKLKLDYIPTPQDLSNFPKISESVIIKTLILFSIIQKKFNIQELNQLSENFLHKLKSVFDDILHSNHIKHDFYSALEEAANTGILDNMVQVFTKNDYIQKDQEGFNNIIQKYKTIKQDLALLNSTKNIFEIAKQKGLNIALNFTYVICTFIVVLILFKII